MGSLSEREEREIEWFMRHVWHGYRISTIASVEDKHLIEKAAARFRLVIKEVKPKKIRRELLRVVSEICVRLMIDVTKGNSKQAKRWAVIKERKNTSRGRKYRASGSTKIQEIIERLAKARLADPSNTKQRSTYAVASFISDKGPKGKDESIIERECKAAGVTPIQRNAIFERIKKLRDSGVIPA